MAESKAVERRLRRARRHARIQKRVRGTDRCPRLVVSRSLRHIEGQLVDDDLGVTILGVSTRSANVGEHLEGVEVEDGRVKVAAAYAAGKLLAERAKEAGFESAVFDRGGYRYHGRVKAFAEGARAGGLEF